MNNFGQIEINALIAGLVSSVIAFLATPLAVKFAWKYGLIDDPKVHKHPKVLHTKPTPRGGGLAIFLALFFSALIFLPFDKHLIGILSGASLILIYGLADDKWNLDPYLRLGLQFAAAALPVIAGINIAFVSNPFGGIINFANIPLLPQILAIFWLVALMNFLNLGAKGLPGQLPGVSAIAALTIAALSLKFSADITQWPVIILASIVAGAFVGFLPWNFFPQRIMPSFSGSNLAGYFLGVLAILSTAKVGTVIVVLGVPLIDTSYTIARRVLSGKSPVWGDRGHLHHRLLDVMGWSQKKVTLFYWAITAFLGLIALTLNTQAKIYTIIGLAIFLGGLILWLIYRTYQKPS